MRRLLRVFPRRTKATPIDDLAVVGEPGLFIPEFDEIHVSCTFTRDKPEAERLAHLWRNYGEVEVGGPAFDAYGEDFVPGRYLKPGYVITSRGCWNHCWFCSVPKREGHLRQIPITEGWNVLDNNLLQLNDDHVRSVFAMLKRQHHRAEFTGGLEARLLRDWHIELLLDLNPKQVFFAYDTKDDYEPLVEAVQKLRAAGFPMPPKSHALRCYVLIGYIGDSLEGAQRRLQQAIELGFTPMAMLWDECFKYLSHDNLSQWRKLQRHYARPAIIHAPVQEWPRGQKEQ